MHRRPRPPTGSPARRFRRGGRPGAPAANPAPGYEELVEIGSGPGATVYCATEPRSGRQVAVKVLKVDVSDPVVLESFQRQMAILEALRDHPNIVTLFRSLARGDGAVVLVTELCRGSLAETGRPSAPLDTERAVRDTIRLAGALETAHRAGLLHRSVKPRNVLLTPFGEPALSDFAVGLLHGPVQGPAGTFEFSAVHTGPEVLEGRAASAAADVYGLAATAYEMITGQAPFQAFEGESPASVILRILRDPPRPAHSPAVPLELSDLLDAALAKNPEHRPKTALALAQSLQAVQTSQGWPTTEAVVWGDGPQARAIEPPPRAPYSDPVELPLPPPTPPPPRARLTINQPLLRSAGPGSREPSVNDPSAGPRSVVVPGAPGRGQSGSPLHRIDPLPPLISGDPVPMGARPVFVDPEPISPGAEIGPPRSVPPPKPQSGLDDAVLTQGGIRTLAFAGLAVAAAVVVVALLLVAGVI